MKKLIAIFIAGISVAAGTVHAASESWVAPGNKFSLNLPDGWQRQPHAIAGPSAIFVAGPKGYDASEFGCVINRRDHLSAGEVSQDVANAVLKTWDQAVSVENSRVSGMGDSEIQSFSNENHGTVQVVRLDLKGILAGKRVYSWKLQFMLAMGGASVSFFTMSCIAPEDAATNDVDKLQGLVSSLKF